MDKDIISQFGLPSYIKNSKTPADASKAIEKRFDGKNDKASLETKEELLSRLAKYQEYIKMKEGLASNAEQVPDQMNGEVPEGMGEYVNQASLGLEDEAAASVASDSTFNPMGIADGLGDTFNLVNSAFNSGVDTSGSQRIQKKNGIAEGVSGLATGAKIGSAIFPGIGTGIGGAIGAGLGFLGAGTHNKGASMANNNYAAGISAENRTDWKFGGNTNQYGGGGLFDKFQNSIPRTDLNQYTNLLPENEDKGFYKKSFTPPNYSPISSKTPEFNGSLETNPWKRAKDYASNNIGNAMSFVPVLGGLLARKNLQKPSTPLGARVDNTYNRNLFDQNSLLNQVNQNDVSGALSEASGGDLGALRRNILAGNLNKNKAISEANIQGSNVERDENRFAYQTGLQQNMFNARLDNDYQQRRAADLGAYNSAKSMLDKNIYEDFGNIGKEIVDKKLVRDMFGYTWDGKYWVDKKGNKHSQQDVAVQIAAKKAEAEKEKNT